MAWTTSATPRGNRVKILIEGVLSRSSGGLAARFGAGLERSARAASSTRTLTTAFLVALAAICQVALLVNVLVATHTEAAEAHTAGVLGGAGASLSLGLALLLSAVLLAVSLREHRHQSQPLTSTSKREVALPLASLTQAPRPADYTLPRLAPASRPALPSGGLESWAQLSARVSHEVRTPLNAVIGFSDVMHRELLGPVGHERYREYLAHIRSSSQALLAATEDTLAITTLLANPKPVSCVPTPLAALVETAWTKGAMGTHPSPPASDRKISRVAGDLVVLVDATAFAPALHNLLKAACCRAKPAGTVDVQAASDCGGVRLTITSRPALPAPSTVPAKPAQLADAVTVERGAFNRHTWASDDWGAASEADASDSEFAVSLARALLELQGLWLVEHTMDGAWTASLDLEQASQHHMLFSPIAC